MREKFSLEGNATKRQEIGSKALDVSKIPPTCKQTPKTERGRETEKGQA